MKKTTIVLLLALFLVSICFIGCKGGGSPADTGPVAEETSFSPEPGMYNYTKEVKLSCKTAGAKIFYTVDGSKPTKESTEYTTPIQVAGHGKKLTIKAIAVLNGKENAVAEAIYTINYGVFPSMTGKIETGDEVELSKVKVGLFFKGSDKGPNAKINPNLSEDNVVGRIFYNNLKAKPGTDVILVPTRLGHVDLKEKTFAIPFPIKPPVRNTKKGTKDWSDGFYPVAWYDNNGNGKLDLKNGGNHALNEINRMATKVVDIKHGKNISCFASFLEQDKLNPKGYQFKYYNVKNKDQYDHLVIDSENNEGFNFKIMTVVDK